MTEQNGNNKPNEAEGLAFPVSGNEREALERVLLTSFDYADIDPSVRELADAILAAGFRRSEVVPEPSADWYDLAVKAFPWDASEGDAVLDARRRMVQVLTDNFPEPSTECPQCHRPDGLHKLGCGERFGSEPQGEPSDAALYAAFKAFRAHERKQEFNEFDELTCSECGYAYTWKAPDGRYVVLPRRRERHIAREALRAAGGAR